MLNLLRSAGEFSLLLLKAADEKSTPSCGIFLICILAFCKIALSSSRTACDI
jgi:hypothetical protein